MPCPNILEGEVQSIREILIMTLKDQDEQTDESANERGQLGPDSGGQSGDTQGLSSLADGTDESVEELTDTGQDYEAGVVQGTEDAANHPERPVYTRENQPRPPEIPPDRGSQ
jgi:hypothetical protein